MNTSEVLYLLFVDMLKIMAVVLAYMFGKQMVGGRYDPDQREYTFWQKTFTYCKGIFGCIIATMLLGIGDHFKIRNITIELFLLMAIPCSLGIMEGYNKDGGKFKPFKRNNP